MVRGHQTWGQEVTLHLFQNIYPNGRAHHVDLIMIGKTGQEALIYEFLYVIRGQMQLSFRNVFIKKLHRARTLILPQPKICRVRRANYSMFICFSTAVVSGKSENWHTF